MSNETQSIEQVALDNCEREPVHIPGRIQSFGALVACDLKTLDIVGISRNFQDDCSSYQRSKTSSQSCRYL